MASWRVGASRDLPLGTSDSWDGSAARSSIFAWAGFDGDNPDPAKARRGFLLYDSDAPELKGSYKLPFARVVNGTLTAMPGGLRAAASRLPQTDAPDDVLQRARGVLDAYFKRMESMMSESSARGNYERKALPFHPTDLKAVEGGGWEVAGYASTFGGSPDSYGDIVARGAFVNSLAKRQTKLLYQHDPHEPIGKQLALAEDDQGLFGRWSILPVDTGVKAHQLLSAGLLDSLSIGFVTVDADYREDGVRVIKEAELFEVSLVTFPANDAAVVTSFKADLPTDQLCTRAVEALRVAVREAAALHARRAEDGRALNDRQREAVEALRRAAEAGVATLAALVAPPEAKAGAGDPETLALWQYELELRRLRREYHLPALMATGD